jgi:uncharacterized protein YdhG (YjbR/CyaY superfamily)
MPPAKILRESHFPAIEKRHGKTMKYWFSIMDAISEKKYPEQMKYLREKFGFSQTHANALIMYKKGSKSAQRFTTVKDYYGSIDPLQVKTIKSIFRAITSKYPDLDLVVAWNKPMLKIENRLIFGVGTAKNHILIAPWDAKTFKKYAKKFVGCKINKKTIGVPNDWVVDKKLLQEMIKQSLAASKS